MFVAIPTAMPPAPLTNRFGKRAGALQFLPAAVIIGLESTVSLSKSPSRKFATLASRLGVAHRRRGIRSIDRSALTIDGRTAR